jgi:hypothetical protein
MADINIRQIDGQSTVSIAQLGDHSILLTAMLCALQDFQSETAAMNHSLHATLKAREDKITELTKLVWSCKEAAAQPEVPLVRYEIWHQTMLREVMTTLRVMTIEAMALLRLVFEGITDLVQLAVAMIFFLILVFCVTTLYGCSVPLGGRDHVLWHFR